MFDSNLNFIQSFGTRAWCWSRPAQGTSEGNIYVVDLYNVFTKSMCMCDKDNARVQVFDSNLKFV